MLLNRILSQIWSQTLPKVAEARRRSWNVSAEENPSVVQAKDLPAPRRTFRTGNRSTKSSWTSHCRWRGESSSGPERAACAGYCRWCSGFARRRQLGACNGSCSSTNHRRLWQHSFLGEKAVLWWIYWRDFRNIATSFLPLLQNLLTQKEDP